MSRISPAIFAVLLAAATPLAAQSDVSRPREDVLKAAQTGLSTLAALAAMNQFGGLGLASREDAARAVLGAPIESFNIQLDALKAYQPGTAPDTLLVPSGNVVFPVLIDGQVRSSITVTRSATGFAPSAYGPMVAATAAAAVNDPQRFIVRVPALGVEFIGTRSGGTLLLNPVVADPRLRYEPGRPVAATAVLDQLVPLAVAYNGLPI